MQGFSFEEVKKEYEWPVKFDIPIGVDKKGDPEYVSRKVICLFNLLPKSDVFKILRGELTDEQADDELLAKIFAGWKEGQVKDESGQELDDSAENITRFLDLPFLRKPIILAYFASLGGQKAQRKN